MGGNSYRMAVGSEPLLGVLAANPAEAAIMLDVDGTLAPIVARPELASVPDETRAELRRLVARYALVACISGRTGVDARKVVCVDGPGYVGVHGLELAPEAGCGRCWSPGGDGGGGVRAATRPTARRSAGSRGSTSRYEWPSPPWPARLNCARPRTSWSRARPGSSSCFAFARRAGARATRASG